MRGVPPGIPTWIKRRNLEQGRYHGARIPSSIKSTVYIQRNNEAVYKLPSPGNPLISVPSRIFYILAEYNNHYYELKLPWEYVALVNYYCGHAGSPFNYIYGYLVGMVTEIPAAAFRRVKKANWTKAVKRVIERKMALYPIKGKKSDYCIL